MVKIFISHSSKDESIAAQLVEFLKTSLKLGSSDIRCSSVDGYRFEGNKPVDEQMKEGCKNSAAFVALLSTNSLASADAMFELGARWSTDKGMWTLLVPGAGTELIRGRLKLFNASNCSNESHLHQLVKEIAETLNVELESPAAYIDSLKVLSQMPSSVSAPLTSSGSDAISLSDLHNNVLHHAAHCGRNYVTCTAVTQQFGVTEQKARLLLEQLEDHKFLDRLIWVFEQPTRWSLTQAGREFLDNLGML